MISTGELIVEDLLVILEIADKTSYLSAFACQMPLCQERKEKGKLREWV